jgi:hypothetical protein
MRNIISTLCFVLVASFIMLATVSTIGRAQSNEPPSRQFGVGVFTGTTGGGLTGTYAIDHHMQVGTYFALGISSGGGASETVFDLGPFFRYQFPSVVSPYIQGGFLIQTAGGQTNAGLVFGGGLAYYFARTFGIHADVDVLSFTFTTPSLFGFGWNSTRIGAMWFF